MLFSLCLCLTCDEESMPMLDKIRITPLAAESLGVRSMCTMVETPDVNVLLDAGISLCPYRFNLPPHPIEFKAIENMRGVIAEAADRTDIVTISHYHFDHHTPSYEDWLVNWTEEEETARQIYQNKRVLLKNPRETINSSQRKRAWIFHKTGGKHAKTLEKADGREFAFGKTLIHFSDPVPHGPENTVTGWVIMTLIECERERFMFAPDVQGPIVEETLRIIKNAKPHVLMLGGPPFYLADFRISEAHLRSALKNLESLAETVPLTILEHHSLRDETWRERTQEMKEKAEKKHNNIMTAAEFVGIENRFLESWRKKLYTEYPPSRDFEKWVKEELAKERAAKPPI